jgi:hypothetical protein
MSDDILHEDGETEPELTSADYYEAEDRAWRKLFRALAIHFTHECGEGEPCDTYRTTISAIIEAIKASEELDEFEAGEEE